MEKSYSVLYKQVADTSIHVDIYPPAFLAQNSSVNFNPNSNGVPSVPAVIYFHGGGLTVGNRQTWTARWMQRRVNAAGMAFISPDYRLMPPSNGHDMVADIQDLFAFLTRGPLSPPDPSAEGDARFSRFLIDPNAIAVAGCSAGGLCAYLAAIHVSPKPKALISMYGMGGDFFTPHYVSLKTSRFFRGRDLLDPIEFSDFIHPFSSSLPTIADSPLSYYPQTHSIPGYPANPRMLLARLYLQLGVFIDYYTGQHEPSLSADLKRIVEGEEPLDYDSLAKRLQDIIPSHHRGLFPQLSVGPDWPPTLLCHGVLDTAVPIQDSRRMHLLLQEAGVPVEYLPVEADHSFDFEPDAEVKYAKELISIGDFIERWLTKKSINVDAR